MAYAALEVEEEPISQLCDRDKSNTLHPTVEMSQSSTFPSYDVATASY